MSVDLGIGLSALALVVGFPVLLLSFVLFLGRMEEWMLRPDERAAVVNEMLEQVEEAEQLEKAVAVMLSDVTNRPSGRRRRGRALRFVGGRLRQRRRAQAQMRQSRARRAGREGAGRDAGPSGGGH